MKNIKIKYNPYLVETEILVDGAKPKQNSSLNVNGKRLQEWIEKLPDIITVALIFSIKIKLVP